MQKNKQLNKLVADYLNVPKHIQHIANIATFDLYSAFKILVDSTLGDSFGDREHLCVPQIDIPPV